MGTNPNFILSMRVFLKCYLSNYSFSTLMIFSSLFNQIHGYAGIRIRQTTRFQIIQPDLNCSFLSNSLSQDLQIIVFGQQKSSFDASKTVEFPLLKHPNTVTNLVLTFQDLRWNKERVKIPYLFGCKDSTSFSELENIFHPLNYVSQFGPSLEYFFHILGKALPQH